jgi:hypothetical protein
MYQTPQCIFPNLRMKEFYDPRRLTRGNRVCVRMYDHNKNYIEEDDDDRGYMFLGSYNRDPFPVRNGGVWYPLPPFIFSHAQGYEIGTIDGIVEEPGEWNIGREQYSGYIIRINGQRYRYTWKQVGVYTTDEIMGDLISRENGFPEEIQNMIGRFTHGKSRYPNSRIDFFEGDINQDANTTLLVLGAIFMASFLLHLLKKK